MRAVGPRCTVNGCGSVSSQPEAKFCGVDEIDELKLFAYGDDVVGPVDLVLYYSSFRTIQYNRAQLRKPVEELWLLLLLLLKCNFSKNN